MVIPESMVAEVRKATEILRAFTMTKAESGIDMMIPPDIISSAKGIAILSVIKAGFLFSARAGAGLVVARLNDGTWSSPSAIGTGGMGAGLQIGVEQADHVFILNSDQAVNAFMVGSNVTLGTNLSVAAGPIGRSGEGAVSARSAAAIYTYSRTKGAFAGLSLEGTVIVVRNDENARFYGQPGVKPKQILSGAVRQEGVELDRLYEALNAQPPPGARRSVVYDRAGPPPSRPPPPKSAGGGGGGSGGWAAEKRSGGGGGGGGGKTYDPAPLVGAPTRPAAPPRKSIAERVLRARALFDFAGDQPGDLGFRAGDSIDLIECNGPQDSSWWKGKKPDGSEGIFPANFVQME